MTKDDARIHATAWAAASIKLYQRASDQSELRAVAALAGEMAIAYSLIEKGFDPRSLEELIPSSTSPPSESVDPPT